MSSFLTEWGNFLTTAAVVVGYSAATLVLVGVVVALVLTIGLEGACGIWHIVRGPVHERRRAIAKLRRDAREERARQDEKARQDAFTKRERLRVIEARAAVDKAAVEAVAMGRAAVLKAQAESATSAARLKEAQERRAAVREDWQGKKAWLAAVAAHQQEHWHA